MTRIFRPTWVVVILASLLVAAPAPSVAQDTEIIQAMRQGDGQPISLLPELGTLRASTDGRYVVYVTRQDVGPATGVVDANGTDDIVLWDRVGKTVTVVSHDGQGGTGDGPSTSPQISDDGRFVYYTTSATNTGDAPGSGGSDLIRWDRDVNTSRSITVSVEDGQGCGGTTGYLAAADGSGVVFGSSCPTLFTTADDDEWSLSGNGLYLWRPGRLPQLLDEAAPGNASARSSVGCGAEIMWTAPDLSTTAPICPVNQPLERFASFVGDPDYTGPVVISGDGIASPDPTLPGTLTGGEGPGFAGTLRASRETVSLHHVGDTDRCPGWGLRTPLCVVDGNGTASRPEMEFTDPDQHAGQDLVLAADGSAFVYRVNDLSTGKALLYHHDVATGSNQLLTRDEEGNPRPVDGLVPQAAMSGDGRHVVTRQAHETIPTQNGTTPYFLFDANTGTSTQLFVDPVDRELPIGSGGFADFNDLVISQDGTTVIFRSRTPLLNDVENFSDTLYAMQGAAPPPVVIAAMEINQGIQTRVVDVPASGTVQYPTFIPIVTGRDTLVRMYVIGLGAGSTGHEVPLRVELVENGEVAMSTVLAPNVRGEMPVDAPPLVLDGANPFRDRILSDRANPAASVEVVIPEAVFFGFQEATALRLTAMNPDGTAPISGTVEAQLVQGKPLRVVLKSMTDPRLRDSRTGARIDPVNRATFARDISPYTEQALPFDRVDVITEIAQRIPYYDQTRTLRIRTRAGTRSVRLDDCSLALHNSLRESALLRRGHRDATDYTAYVAYAPRFASCLGVTTTAIQGVRRGHFWPLVTTSFGDTFAHEVVHTMGVPHAGNAHGEGNGEVWPYAHGALQPDDEDLDNQAFGAIIHGGTGGSSLLVPLSDRTYDVEVLDACPAANAAARNPCSRSDHGAHELMSYGASHPSFVLDPLVAHSRRRWPSGITWRRATASMTSGLFDPPIFTQAVEEEFYAITAVRLEDGQLGLLPPIRLTGTAETAEGDGDLVLEARDVDGNVLATSTLGAPSDDGELELFAGELPASDQVASIALIEDGQESVFERSTNAPTVTIDTPTDSPLVAAPMNLAVTVADADGDDLDVLVSASQDGGVTWTPVFSDLVVSSGELPLDLGSLSGSDDVLLQVDVSDGLRTTSATAQFSMSPVLRLSAAGRVGTGVEVSTQAFPDGALVAVLARADSYPDALSGASLAATQGGPLLLTNSDGLSAEVAEELQRLRVETVYLLGGSGALSEQVATDLAGLGVEDVQRLSGDSRFATGAAVAALVPSTHAFVVEGANADPGRGWPDAVSGSALAAFRGDPMLLVTRDDLPGPTAAAITELGITSVTIVGGEAAVSAAVAAQLEQLGVAVDRIAGPSRFLTSVAVATEAEAAGADGGRLWIATGDNFPDALTAGPAAAANGGVLMLAPSAGIAPVAEIGAWLASHPDTSRVTLVGGAAALSPDTEGQVVAALQP